jgi:hypothetical protein
VALARTAASGNGEDHRHVGRIDLLLERDANRSVRPRSVSACRNGALQPYPALASTQQKRAPAARTRHASTVEPGRIVRPALE